MIIPYYCEDYPEDPPEYRPVKKTKNGEEEKKSTPPSKGSPHSENEEAQKRSDPSKTSK